MKILGIGFLSESSVTLIENGVIKYAISEERLNRIKNWWGNPYRTIKFVLKQTNNKIKDIDIFATHGLSAITQDIPSKLYFNKKIEEIKNSSLSSILKKNKLIF